MIIKVDLILKAVFICIFLHITTLAQKNITIYSGYNFSTIKYNQDNINESVNFNFHRGLNIGIEYRFPKIIAGFGYFQRGSSLSRATKLNIGGIDYNIDISGHEVYNYLSAHLVYPYKLNQSLELFAGIQIGKGNNGESLAKLKFTDFNSSRSDNIDLKSEDFNIDQGIKLGMNYMLNSNLGFRASYFYGLSDVRSNLDDSLNFRNNSFQVSLLMNFKKMTIKPQKKLLDSTKSIRSKLIIPAKSIFVQVGSKTNNSANVKSSMSVNYGIRDNTTVGVRKNEHLNTLDIYISTNEYAPIAFTYTTDGRYFGLNSFHGYLTLIDHLKKSIGKIMPFVDENGKFTIILPSGTAYGKDGNINFPVIPGNSVLIFEIHLLKIRK